MRRTRLTLITAGLATVLLTAAPSVVATGSPAVANQLATPTAGRDVPSPSECTVELGTAEDVLALVRDVAATPGAVTSTAASPTPFVPPSGEPADAATVAAVEAANRELLACTNAYGFLGLVAVSTERHVRDVLARDVADGLTEEDFAGFLAATPEPSTPEQSVALVDVRDVTVLGDGRIGAVVVGDEPGVGEVTLYFIFAEERGRFLLDEQFELPSDETPEP